MRLAVVCSWLAVVACSSSSRNSVPSVDGSSGSAGSAGSGGAGSGGESGAGGSVASTPKWPDSATLNCSDGTISNTSCPANGAAYYGQDGNFEINVPSYLLDGVQLTDSVTELVWRTGSGDATQSEAAAGCESFGADWRLPSFLEVASLMDYGNGGNAVPSAVAAGAPTLWTASNAPVASAVWTFSNTGMPSIQAVTGVLASVCVAGSEAAGELGVPTDSVVRDSRTGLYWQTGTVTNRTWEEALLYCLKAQGRGLVTGWRLPSIKELLTIAKTDTLTAIDLGRFNTEAIVWSSTPLPDDGSQAFAVDFGPLKVSGLDVTLTADVRCVHDPS